MKFPKLLQKGDTIGVCAPSEGVAEDFGLARMDSAHTRVRQLGYKSVETPSVRSYVTYGSADDAKKRALEFISLFETPMSLPLCRPMAVSF